MKPPAAPTRELAGRPGSTPSLLPPPPVSDEDDSRTSKRLQLFMGTRLGVATLLLGGTLLIALEDQRGFDSFTPQFLVSLIAAIYAASLMFAVWLLGSEQRDRVALAQVACDLVFTSALIYVTGGATSGFTFLYGVAVLMAAMVIGPTSARVTGGAAVLLYAALTLALSRGWIPPPSDQSPDAYTQPISAVLYVGLLNVLGLTLVTALAGNLAARLSQAGGKLALAEASAATLARLNDDIVRSLSSGLLTTDLSGNIRMMNPTGAELFGRTPGWFIDRPVAELLPIDGKTLASKVAHAARTEETATRPDGGTFPVGYTVSPLISLDGDDIGLLVLFQDLSEITRLREAAARGERLAVLGRLSAGLAHEIRNPLSSISGSVELVRDSTELDEEERRLLGIVLNEVGRLDELVSTMLQVGRPREPQRTHEDLRGIIDIVVEMARRGPSATMGVDIETDLPDTPVLAHVDGDQVRQVIWNLVKNSLQASPRGTTVRVSARTGAGPTAILKVSDEGRGLDSSQRDKVYNMFYSERTHGAGIGLALVRQIVDAHKGSIDIDSTQTRGATFTVTLPGVAAAEAAS